MVHFTSHAPCSELCFPWYTLCSVLYRKGKGRRERMCACMHVCVCVSSLYLYSQPIPFSKSKRAQTTVHGEIRIVTLPWCKKEGRKERGRESGGEGGRMPDVNFGIMKWSKVGKWKTKNENENEKSNQGQNPNPNPPKPSIPDSGGGEAYQFWVQSSDRDRSGSKLTFVLAPHSLPVPPSTKPPAPKYPSTKRAPSSRSPIVSHPIVSRPHHHPKITIINVRSLREIINLKYMDVFVIGHYERGYRPIFGSIW